MNRLRLHRVKEGFHEGIVRDLARTVHALRDVQLGQAFAESIGGILDAAVGVEDQTPLVFNS